MFGGGHDGVEAGEDLAADGLVDAVLRGLVEEVVTARAEGGGRYDLLDEATQDCIHQPVRGEIFPGLNPIMSAAKEAGAAASYLSGAGSTVAALTNTNAERIARLMTQAAIAAGYSGRSIITKPTNQGAYVVG